MSEPGHTTAKVASVPVDVDCLTLPPSPTAPTASRLGAVPPDLQPTDANPIVSHVGDYEILEELGRGGMGVVYKARHVKLKRLVALKMILAGNHACAQDRSRFLQEAEAVARLQHPNIVQIHEVGEQDGRPFLVLEFVDGGSLAALLNGAPQGPHAAARLMLPLARAMHYAHQHNVIHRDLKPGNVLLTAKSEPGKELEQTRKQDSGRSSLCMGLDPKVTDFGLAKQTDCASGQTQSGDVIGTPSYMAPEQAGGKTHDIGPATDVYALGAILYELLTGRPPFRAAKPLDTVLQVLYTDPVPPTRLQPNTPRDLETICLKCLQKEPRKRYASAEALADDLQRFLNEEPILARPASLGERGVKWVHRNPMPAALVGVSVLAALTIVGGGIVEQARLRSALLTAEQERDRANYQRQLADGRQVRLTVANGVQLVENGDLLAALPWFAEALRLEQDNAQREQMHRQRLAVVLRDSPRPVQVWTHKGGIIWDAQFSADGRYVVTTGEDQTAHVWDAMTGKPIGAPLEHDEAVRQAFFGPAPSGGTPGRVITVSGSTVQVWEIASGTLRAKLAHTRAVQWATLSPDGSRIVTASLNGTAQVWDAASGKAVGPPLLHQAAALYAAFSSNGERIVTTSADGTAQVWETATGRTVGAACKHAQEVYSAAFSPDGKWVVTSSEDDTARLWDAATGQPVSSPLRHNSRVNHAAFSPDGRLVATCSSDNSVRFWEAPSGRMVGPVLRHGSDIYQVVFSPDGRRVVTASDDNTARVWDVLTGEPLSAPLRHNGTVRRASFSPDGRWVLTASEDGLARMWETRSALKLVPAMLHDSRVTQASFSPDGSLVVTASEDRLARVWNSATGKQVGPPLRHDGKVYRSLFSPDGQQLLTASADGSACLWRMDNRKLLCPPLRHAGDVLDAGFSPDGSLVVTASADATARVWDAATGQPITPPLRHERAVVRAGFDPDGQRVVTASADRSARIWDVRSGKMLLPPLQHARKVHDAGFSPDGKRVVTASEDQTARLWDASTGKELTEPLKHGSKVYRASFSPDGLRVATASDDNTARVWDAATGHALTPPLQHTGSVYRAVFSPDGRLLLTASDENTARVWDARTGELLAPPLRHKSGVQDVSFSPDGRRVVSGGADRIARIWQLPPEERPMQDLLDVAQVLAGGQIDQVGGFVPLHAGELLRMWQALRAKYPKVFTPNTEDR